MAKEMWLIDPEIELIPDVGLGDYVEGFSSNVSGEGLGWGGIGCLIPIGLLGGAFASLGLFFFFYDFFKHWEYSEPFLLVVFPCIVTIGILLWLWYDDKTICRYWIYTNGFVWENITRKEKKIKEQKRIEFRNVLGISLCKVINYETRNMIRRYTGTNIDFDVKALNGNSLFSGSDSYHSKSDNIDSFGYDSLAFHSIMSVWNKIALERFYRELKEKGYGTFYTGGDNSDIEIRVGEGFLKYGNSNYIEGNYKYSFDNGKLVLFKTKEHNGDSEKFEIDINTMYNSQVFLIAIDKLLGIK